MKMILKLIGAVLFVLGGWFIVKLYKELKSRSEKEVKS